MEKVHFAFKSSTCTLICAKQFTQVCCDLVSSHLCFSHRLKELGEQLHTFNTLFAFPCAAVCLIFISKLNSTKLSRATVNPEFLFIQLYKLRKQVDTAHDVR